jgi:uncharacterized MAPEG superfamily protein
MSVTLQVLIGYTLWVMALALSYPLIRTVLVAMGKKRADEFPADAPHEGSPLYRRLWRAHLNGVENLPLVAAVLLAAAVSGQTQVSDTLAPWLLGARVLQSSIHIAAVTHATVSVRAVFWMAQLAILAWISLGLLGVV